MARISEFLSGISLLSYYYHFSFELKVIDMSEEEGKSLREFVYDNLVDAILSTLNKLNLTTQKESELDGKMVRSFIK